MEKKTPSACAAESWAVSGPLQGGPVPQGFWNVSCAYYTSTSLVSFLFWAPFLFYCSLFIHSCVRLFVHSFILRVPGG